MGSRLEWHRWTLPYWNQVPLWLWKGLSASAEGWGVTVLTALAFFQKRSLAWKAPLMASPRRMYFIACM
jgi:hypothetical protein